jgi:hypothetical protein
MRSLIKHLTWWWHHVSYTWQLLWNPHENARGVSNYVERLHGMFPRPNPHGIIFFACDTQFMNRFGYSLLFSCYEQAPACSVHIHLYEPTAAVLDRLTVLRAQLPDMLVSYTYEEAIDQRSLPDLQVYYTALRFLVAKKVLEESHSVVICLDADSLVQQSLTPVVAEARGYDVGLYFRLQKHDIRKKIAAFCVILNTTPRGMVFLEFFTRLLSKFYHQYPAMRSGRPFHFDQSCLYCSYVVQRFTTGFSCYRIGKEVVDYHVATAARIWTAKGQRKQEAEFLQAVGKIREKYASLPRVACTTSDSTRGAELSVGAGAP